MPTLETVARNNALNGIVDPLDGGDLVFETVTDNAVATLPLATPAFGDASAGSVSAATITDNTNAAGGSVVQASLFTSGAAKVLEYTAGTSGTEIIMSSSVIGVGDTVACSALGLAIAAS